MAKTKIDNERKACDAVARSLEDLLKTKRSKPFSPEEEKEHEVEYVFDLGNQKYAIEHTNVEAFDGQIGADVDFESFVTPITEALDKLLPTHGEYNLLFPLHRPRCRKAKQISGVQRQIIEWARRNATLLHAECPKPPQRSKKPYGHRSLRKETIEGVEVHLSYVTGWWMADDAAAKIYAGRIAPDDCENCSVKRLQTAMSDKLPKLQSWKEKGARSVLVFENRDIALSSPGTISNAVQSALVGRDDQPDEIWLVETTTQSVWTVRCLVRDDHPWPDEDTLTRYRHFNPHDLVKVGGVRREDEISTLVTQGAA